MALEIGLSSYCNRGQISPHLQYNWFLGPFLCRMQSIRCFFGLRIALVSWLQRIAGSLANFWLRWMGQANHLQISRIEGPGFQEIPAKPTILSKLPAHHFCLEKKKSVWLSRIAENCTFQDFWGLS